ncbi:MAG: DUF4258 domain-containing protein [Gallionellaceae bacterium]|jgi:hypothetical protein
MFEFEYTTHAQTVATSRAIKNDWVVSTLTTPELQIPDREDPELMHALSKIPENENRVLRVEYNATTDPVRIVTVYFDRTMRGKL